MALGAGRRSVVGLVLRDGLWMATTGVIAGAAIALAMERVAGGLLFRISPNDPSTYAALAAVLIVLARAGVPVGPPREPARSAVDEGTA